MEKNKDKVEEKEDKFGDLDQLLRIERLKEQKDETLKPEADETQVSRFIYKPSHRSPMGLYRIVNGDRSVSMFLLVSHMQEDTDPDKLKPYKKDLEYLDDHFQVNSST